MPAGLTIGDALVIHGPYGDTGSSRARRGRRAVAEPAVGRAGEPGGRVEAQDSVQEGDEAGDGVPAVTQVEVAKAVGRDLGLVACAGHAVIAQATEIPGVRGDSARAGEDLGLRRRAPDYAVISRVPARQQPGTVRGSGGSLAAPLGSDHAPGHG